jgi:hypothetical protein
MEQYAQFSEVAAKTDGSEQFTVLSARTFFVTGGDAVQEKREGSPAGNVFPK